MATEYEVWILWDGAGWYLDSTRHRTPDSATKVMVKRIVSTIRRPLYSDGVCLRACVVEKGNNPVRNEMALVSAAAMIGSVRIEITRFRTNARVVLPDGGGLGLGTQIVAWERESDEAVALAESIIRGECPPAIFADYIEEHPYAQSPASCPLAAQRLREGK